MRDELSDVDGPLKGPGLDGWMEDPSDVYLPEGEVHSLGDKHSCMFSRRSDTLLVSFEVAQASAPTSEMPQSTIRAIAEAKDWSHLAVVSLGTTWFRDQDAFALFDYLTDTGLFDDFDQILFYGSGSCGYAAAVFSVAAPGATVLAIQPQATLDPRLCGWDTRFRDARRISFTDRYGFAPDMLDAAAQAFVLYDPSEKPDAIHAAMMARQNVTLLRMPNMGETLEQSLQQMSILEPLLELAATGELTASAFHRLYRARRNNIDYLLRLLARLNRENRHYLKYLLCRDTIARMPRRRRVKRFRRQMARLKTAMENREVLLPYSATR